MMTYHFEHPSSGDQGIVSHHLPEWGRGKLNSMKRNRILGNVYACEESSNIAGAMYFTYICLFV